MQTSGTVAHGTWRPTPIVWSTQTRFVVSDGYIYDTTTGLEWCIGPDVDTDWHAANAWISASLHFQNPKDEQVTHDEDLWRLPNRSELEALIDAGIANDNWGLFSNSGSMVWTVNVYSIASTTREYRSDLARAEYVWYVDFSEYRDDWKRSSAFIDMRAFAVRERPN